MHSKVKEAPLPGYLAPSASVNESREAEDAAFAEDALARDAALRAGGPAIEWDAFEAWVRARLTERIGGLPTALIPGA